MNIGLNCRYKLLESATKKKILLRNKAIANTHVGERCFILGNGPSLKEENLSLLEGETVFTVNQAFRNPAISKLSPKCHFWVDKNFFEIDENRPEDVELLEYMKKASNSSEDIICLYPIEQFDFVNKMGLYVENRTFFIYPLLFIGNPKKFSPNISRITYGFGTVVQNAIVTAIYMGFKEIYILGCDSTGIINTLNASLKISNDDYGYRVTENEKLRMEKMVANSNVKDYAYSYYLTLKGFEYLYNACVAKGITLVNCSSKTVLDMIPRSPLEQVVKEKS